MNAQTVTMTAAQSVEIAQAGGDLVVQGWDKPELEARGDGVKIQQSEGSVRVTSRDDLVLSVPRNARLEVSTVGGDVRIENLDEAVSLSVVGGDVVLRNLSGPVSLNGPVGGDTRFENVAQVSVAGGRAGAGNEFSQRAQREAERQLRRAEERLRQAEKRIDRARGRPEVDFGSWLGRRKGGPSGSDEAKPQVSDEERMAILRMLQEKKITSAEADALLAALEGEQVSPPAGADKAGS
jgi:hypothetical protein